jgi:hypothetical protein
MWQHWRLTLCYLINPITPSGAYQIDIILGYLNK